MLEGAGHTQAADKVRLQAVQMFSVIYDPSRICRQKTGDYIEKGSLACAVRPDNACDSILGDIQGEIIKGNRPIKILVYVYDT